MALFDFVSNNFRKAKDDLVKSRFNLADQTRSAIALAKPKVQQGVQRVQTRVAQRPGDFFLPNYRGAAKQVISPQRLINTVRSTPNLTAVKAPSFPKTRSQVIPAALQGGGYFAQEILNTFPRAGRGLANIGDDAMNKRLTPQRTIANLAPLGEAFLTVGTGGGSKVATSIAKEAFKQGSKRTALQILKRGARQGALGGGTFGLLQGLSQNGDSSNVFQQFIRSTPSAGAGAIFGGALGGGLTVPGAVKSKLSNMLVKKHKISSEVANKAVDSYVRNKFGQFAGKVKGKSKSNFPLRELQVPFGSRPVRSNQQAEINKRLGRDPKTQLYFDDLERAIGNVKDETEKRIGLQVRDVNKDAQGRLYDVKLEPLVKEARKYKSAEEFMQGSYDATPVSNSPEMIKFGTELSNDVKKIDRFEFLKSLPKDKKGNFSVDPKVEINKMLTNFNKKYGTSITEDDFIGGNIPNRNDLYYDKYKSQLTDLWNKANKSVAQPPQQGGRLYDAGKDVKGAFLTPEGKLLKVAEHEVTAAGMTGKNPAVMLASPKINPKTGMYDMVPSSPTSSIEDIAKQGYVRIRGESGGKVINVDLRGVNNLNDAQLRTLQNVTNNGKKLINLDILENGKTKSFTFDPKSGNTFDQFRAKTSANVEKAILQDTPSGSFPTGESKSRIMTQGKLPVRQKEGGVLMTNRASNEIIPPSVAQPPLSDVKPKIIELSDSAWAKANGGNAGMRADAKTNTIYVKASSWAKQSPLFKQASIAHETEHLLQGANVSEKSAFERGIKYLADNGATDRELNQYVKYAYPNNVKAQDQLFKLGQSQKVTPQPPLGDVKIPVKKIQPQIKALEVKSPILKATGTARTPETNPSRLLVGKNPTNLSTVSSPNIIQPRSTRGGITPPKVDFTKWKDGETLSLTRETLERNIEGVAKGDSKVVKEFIVDPVRVNETQRIKFLTQTKQEIKDTVKRLGISAGSKEDKLIQRFGEGNMTAEELRAATPKWQQVMEGSQYFRSKYDALLDQVNAQRQQFGYNPIPKRKDYFRHFQEINDAIGQFGLLLREQDIPTEISGLTSIFKPGKPFSTAELQRKGVKTTESAIKGMDNYLDSISKQMFHIDSVQRARSLETYIRDAAKEGKADLPNFVANIREYGNLVSGKKGTFDRAFEGILGRKVYGLSRFLTERTSANLVGGNISSAFTNVIPFTQSVATTSKPAALRGIMDGLGSPFSKNFAKIGGVESKFLVRRFGNRGPIAPSILQRGGEVANWVFKTIDQFTSKSIVSGKYYQALSEGKTPQQAIKIADEYAGKIVTDRSLGNLPNLFGQKTLGPFTQFQAEVNNMYSFIKKDIPNISDGNALKITNALAQFAVLSYVYNNAFEKIAGRRPTLDPLQAGLTAMGMTDDSEGGDFGGNVISAGGDLAENLPFSGILSGGGRIPISAGIPDIPGLIKGETNIGKEALKPLTTLLPPFGGGQLKKSIEGLNSFNEGVSTTPTGRIRFKVEQTPSNLAKNVIFGQYSTDAGRKYVQNLGKSKSEIIANDFKKLKTPQEKKDLWNQYVKEGKITKENVSDIKKQFEDQALEVKSKEKTIRGLPVQDGSRTRAILREFNKLDTAEEKKALWNRYVELGIITKEVAKQLKTQL